MSKGTSLGGQSPEKTRGRPCYREDAGRTIWSLEPARLQFPWDSASLREPLTLVARRAGGSSKPSFCRQQGVWGHWVSRGDQNVGWVPAVDTFKRLRSWLLFDRTGEVQEA